MDRYAYIVDRKPSDKCHIAYTLGTFDDEEHAKRIAECYTSKSDGVMWTTSIEKRRLHDDEFILDYRGHNTIKRFKKQSPENDLDETVKKYKTIKEKISDIAKLQSKLQSELVSLDNQIDDMLIHK